MGIPLWRVYTAKAGGTKGEDIFSDNHLPLHPLTEGDNSKLLQTENCFFMLCKLYEPVNLSVTLCL